MMFHCGRYLARLSCLGATYGPLAQGCDSLLRGISSQSASQ